MSDSLENELDRIKDSQFAQEKEIDKKLKLQQPPRRDQGEQSLKEERIEQGPVSGRQRKKKQLQFRN